MFMTAFDPTSLDSWLKEYPYLPGLLFAAFCLLVLFFVALPRIRSSRRARGRKVLDPVQAEELLMGAGALVVDLRSLEAFRTGHIRGSLHLPFPELASRFTAPDTKAKRALILMDETDELSHKAYDLLLSRGFDWLYVLKGGMRAWKSASRPVVK